MQYEAYGMYWYQHASVEKTNYIRDCMKIIREGFNQKGN